MMKVITSLQELPLEILINICSFLEESDIIILQSLNKFFNTLLHDQEFWKKLIYQKFLTLKFPSLSRQDSFIEEFYERKRILNDWKHNKVIKNKYTINPYRSIPTQIERIIFKYPRCYLYHEGIITIVQLNNSNPFSGGYDNNNNNNNNNTARGSTISTRRRTKFTYIPCTTPQGCSTMDFNLHAAVFGRFDGRIFAKLLTNKSFLQPVIEFNSLHTQSSCVTSINIMPDIFETKKTVCVSGTELGEVCWWEDTNLLKRLQLSSYTIVKLYTFNREKNTNYTICVDSKLNCFVVLNRGEIIHEINLINDCRLPHSLTINEILFFRIDYGSMNLIFVTLTNVWVISVDPKKDLGHLKSFELSSKQDERIKDVYIDDMTTMREQNLSIVGEDGCYMAIVLDSNDILILNCRESLETDSKKLRLHKRLIFNEIITACQINNSVLVVTLEDNLKIIDPTTGDLLKTVPKVDKLTQFIRIYDNKIVTATGNNLNVYQFNPNHKFKRHNNKYLNSDGSIRHNTKPLRGHNQVNNKWNINLNVAKKLFDEEEELIQRRINENERLLSEYGGDIYSSNNYIHINRNLYEDEEDEEDINLRIALLESQQELSRSHIHSGNNDNNDEESQLLRAIEQSERLQQQQQGSTASNHARLAEDEELQRVLELSRQEYEQRLAIQASVENSHNISDTQTLSPNIGNLVSESFRRLDISENLPPAGIATSSTEDEDLALAIALSLSEMQ
ncbi:hypothetical protein RI543_000558 [Arxiozyma heterogenica]|uniref:F-box domain-containing protein n=1 Tax=Arxiozyma heterogenica TaxID=278026 RepID=A0AAN8A834_9SACH|nr:hypothetical protein RI543_000558 [Kazachstania heterogenica]